MRISLVLLGLCIVSIYMPALASSKSDKLDQPESGLYSILPSGYKRLAKLYLASEFEQCFKVSKSKKESLPAREQDSIFFLNGICALKLGKIDLARQSLEHSLALRARNSDAIHYLGDIAAAKGEHEQALSKYQEAVWQNSYIHLKISDTLLSKARLYKQLELPEQYLEELELAVSHSNPSEQALLELSSHLISQGKKTEALAYLERLKKMENKQPQSVTQTKLLAAQALLLPTGRVYQTADLRAAKKLSQEMLESQELAPEVTDQAEINLAKSLIGLGELSEAQELLADLKERLPNDHGIERLREQLKIESKIARSLEAGE